MKHVYHWCSHYWNQTSDGSVVLPSRACSHATLCPCPSASHPRPAHTSTARLGQATDSIHRAYYTSPAEELRSPSEDCGKTATSARHVQIICKQSSQCCVLQVEIIQRLNWDRDVPPSPSGRHAAHARSLAHVAHGHTSRRMIRTVFACTHTRHSILAVATVAAFAAAA